MSEKEIGWKTRGTGVYHHLAQQHLATEQEVQPLPEIEPDRKRVPDVLYETKEANKG